MWPSSEKELRNDRAQTDSELASFYAGTQFRFVRKITLAAGASLVLRLTRTVPIIIRGFDLKVTAGQLQLDVLGNPTVGGTWVADAPIQAKNGTGRVPAGYSTACLLASGGTAVANGSTVLIDALDLLTAGATAQASTIGENVADVYGAPVGAGYYKFTNPGNTDAKGILRMWWEELPDVGA